MSKFVPHQLLRLDRSQTGLLQSPSASQKWADCRESPLQPGFDRVLQIGDASGIQSPLSFGGFGALSRHLPRLKAAISDALQVRFLSLLEMQ